MRYAKSFILLLILSLLGCAPRVLVQPAADLEKYNRIAVLPFESDSYLSTVGHQLADEVVIQLLKKVPDLDIVERTRIDALLEEQNLAKSGYLSPETAIVVGKMLGVKGILTGSISLSVGDVRTTRDNEQRVATGVATVRFIDVETGKVLWARREKSDYTLFKSFDGTGESYAVKTDHEMIQEIIDDLAKDVIKPFYPHYEYQY